MDWVDNYLGGDRIFTGNLLDPPAVGTKIVGTAPNGGKLLRDADHSDVHVWYFETIASGGPTEGFEWSVLLGGSGRPNPQSWVRPEPVIRALYRLSGQLTSPSVFGWLPTIGSVTQDLFTVGGQLVLKPA